MQELLQNEQLFSEQELFWYRKSFYRKHSFLSFLLFLPIFPPIGIVFWFLIRNESFIFNKNERIRNIISFLISVFSTAFIFFLVGIPLTIYFLIKETNVVIAETIGNLSLLAICQTIFFGLYRYHNKILGVHNPGKITIGQSYTRRKIKGPNRPEKEIVIPVINWRNNLIIKITGIITAVILVLGIVCLSIIFLKVPIISQFTSILIFIALLPLIILQAIMFFFRRHSLDKADKIFLAITFLSPIAIIIFILLFSLLFQLFNPGEYID